MKFNIVHKYATHTLDGHNGKKKWNVDIWTTEYVVEKKENENEA